MFPAKAVSDPAKSCATAAGNDSVKLWRCATDVERREWIDAHLSEAQKDGYLKLTVLDGHSQVTMLNGTLAGRVGIVDYSGATVFSSDGYNGLLVVPVSIASKWSVMTWKLDGEWAYYEGLMQIQPSISKAVPH
jgi:hypothetical protein